MALLNVDGVNIFYEVIGQGDPLVMIQGYGHYSLQWGNLPSEFAKQYKVIMVDNRGTGRSDKPNESMTIPIMADDIARVLDALSIKKANIFGISMGGLIAQRFAINHSERVINLILGCTFPSGAHHVTPPPEGLRILFDGKYLASMPPEQRTREVFGFLCSEEFIEADPEAYRYYHKVTMENPTPGYIFKRHGEAIVKEDTWEELAGIKVPTLIITGTADKIVPCKNSEIIKGRIPNAELVLLQDKRHSFFIEAMGSTVTFIDGFIKRHTPK
jgi:pimeloyl-ACP methyl ester carboxylesterase